MILLPSVMMLYNAGRLWRQSELTLMCPYRDTPPRSCRGFRVAQMFG